MLCLYPPVVNAKLITIKRPMAYRYASQVLVLKHFAFIDASKMETLNV
jgi:hypothetical protein